MVMHNSHIDQDKRLSQIKYQLILDAKYDISFRARNL